MAPKKDDFSKIGTPFVRTGSLTSLLAGGMLSDLELIDEPTAQKLRMTLFPEGTVVFAKSGMSCMTGNVYVLPEPCYVVSHLACVIPVGDYAVYLKHYFRSNRPSKLVENPSFPSIRLSKIQNMELEIPVRSEMEKQVRSLEHIESLIEWSKEQIAMLDTLVKSRFVEMFGDGQWKRTALSEVADIQGGLTKSGKRDLLPLKLPYLRVANVLRGTLYLDEVLEIGLTAAECEKNLLVEGDLLFVEGNGSADQIGRCAVWDGSIAPCVHQNHLIRVRFDERVLPVYALAYFNAHDGREQIVARAVNTSGLFTLSTGKVKALQMPLPPLPLQQKFADFVNNVDKSRFNLLKAYGSIIALFRVLFP